MLAKILIVIGLVGLVCCALMGFVYAALSADGDIYRGIPHLIRDFRQGLWILPVIPFAILASGILQTKRVSVRFRRARYYGFGAMLLALGLIFFVVSNVFRENLRYKAENEERLRNDQNLRVEEKLRVEECVSGQPTYEQAKVQIDGLAITESEWNYYIREDCRQKWIKSRE